MIAKHRHSALGIGVANSQVGDRSTLRARRSATIHKAEELVQFTPSPPLLLFSPPQLFPIPPQTVNKANDPITWPLQFGARTKGYFTFVSAVPSYLHFAPLVIFTPSFHSN